MPDLVVMLAVLVIGLIAGWLLRGAASSHEGAGGNPRPPPSAEHGAGPDAPAPSRDPDPDVEPLVAAAVAAYGRVVDDWLDDRGDLGDAGNGSLRSFDEAVRRLEHDAPYARDRAEVVAVLEIAEVVRERRSQPLDAPTSAELARLEGRLGREI